MKKTIVTINKINSQYGQHGVDVLLELDILHCLEGYRRQTFYHTGKLPDLEEYLRLEREHFTTNVNDLLHVSFGILVDLKRELETWLNGLPTHYQEGRKGQEIEKVLNVLNAVPEKTNDSWSKIVPVIFIYKKDTKKTRQTRFENALLGIRQMIRTLQEIIDGGEIAQATLLCKTRPAYLPANIVTVDDLRIACESLKDELEYVDKELSVPVIFPDWR